MRLSPAVVAAASSDGSIRFCGAACDDGAHARPADLEIQLVVEGRASCVVAEQRIELRPPTLVIFAPGQRRLLADVSDDFGTWIAAFSPELVRAACPSFASQLLEPAAGSLPTRRVLSRADARQLVDLFEELRMVSSQETFRAGLGYALARACELECSSGRLPAAGQLHSAVEQAASLLRTSAQRIGRAELAALCGISESQLSRLFKQQMGVSLAEFRNRHWIERFHDLFGNGARRTLVEAALEAGFGSYPQFHRVFKRTMGCAPADYARRLQQREPAGPPTRKRSERPGAPVPSMPARAAWADGAADPALRAAAEPTPGRSDPS